MWQSQKAAAPPVDFCPACFHEDRAKTLRADLPVFALWMMTVLPPPGSLWTAMRESGPPGRILIVAARRRPWAASGITEQTCPPSRRATATAAATSAHTANVECWWRWQQHQRKMESVLAFLFPSWPLSSSPISLKHARQGSSHSASSLEEGSSHTLLRRLERESLPELEDAPVSFLPRSRAGLFERITASMVQLGDPESKPEDQKSISSRDQEKLLKIKERLLLEDSDEEEGDLCRICQMGEESSSNPLIQPCRCTGSLQYVHQECIKRWLRSKISSGTNLEAITTCELCKEKLRLNIDNFDIHELYRTHVQSEYDEFISSGLYLVVLLHFCEQRFSDVLGAVDAAGLFNLVRILHEHMDNLEIPHEESDEEVQDNRPSVDFSDLDDDLEEEY
ncbi:hypothetical protein OJAV_G00021310 [Oryzias javanicus]|uniref:RING-type E3 ubiquitin transferase n=1 Tax=Oryzias javanicus TaxID=123683 RepID=A0A3S2MU19_ORYJA|nr:hypothetical protein OJAV_G00021310 [Oryzias javanicus]